MSKVKEGSQPEETNNNRRGADPDFMLKRI